DLSKLATSTDVSVANPTPTISTLSPSSVAAGSGPFTLTVTGTNFVSTSKVRLNGVERTTTFVSATRLTAAILAGDVAAAGSNPAVTVVNPSPAGATSNATTLTVNSGPTVTPASLTV